MHYRCARGHHSRLLDQTLNEFADEYGCKHVLPMEAIARDLCFVTSMCIVQYMWTDIYLDSQTNLGYLAYGLMSNLYDQKQVTSLIKATSAIS